MTTDLDVFHCPLAGISLIEASAGTGKTWNICGLYLRLLLERRLTVQQILVVTFTTAATAAARRTRRPLAFSCAASLPMVVVLPAPLTPTTMITVGISRPTTSGRCSGASSAATASAWYRSFSTPRLRCAGV